MSDLKKGSQKYYSTGHYGLIISYISMIGFNGLVAVLSFLTTSLLLTLLGRSDYGEIVSLTSVSLLLASLSGEWTTQAAVRFGTEEFLNEGRISRIFWNRLAISLGAVTLVLLASPIWGRLLSDVFQFTRMGLVFIAFYMPAQVAWLVLQRVLTPIRRHKLHYPLLALERFVVLVVAVVLYQTDRLEVATILPAYVAGCLLALITALWLVRREIGRPNWPDPATCGQIICYSLPLIPSIMTWQLSTNSLDYLMVRRFVGNAELGVYALAVQISGLAQQIPLIAGQLAGTRVVGMRLKNDMAGLNHFIRNQVVPCLWLWSLASILGAALVSWLGGSWLPEKYLMIRDLAWPLAAVTSIVPVWYIVWTPLLTAYEEVWTVMWSSVATAIVNVSANLLLIPRLGAVGSAWATVLAFIVTSLSAELIIGYRRGSSGIPERGLGLYLPPLIAVAASLAGSILTRAFA